MVGEARVPVERIAPPHPATIGWLLNEPLDTLHEVAREGEVTALQQDVRQVQLGIRDHLVVTALARLRRRETVEFVRAVQRAALHIEPAE
jgi:hypothetical protein